MPLTVPAVPTGIKAGVRTTPWGVLNSAARAELSGSLPTTEKGNIKRGPVLGQDQPMPAEASRVSNFTSAPSSRSKRESSISGLMTIFLNS